MRLVLTGVLLFFVLLIAQNTVMAQDSYLPYSAEKKEKNSDKQRYRNLEITAGYLPKSGTERLKGNLGINNLFFHRLGVYSSMEYDPSNNNVINTTGGSITLHPFLYLWGGMDLFSTNGLFQSGFTGSRKEAGIGITPYKWLVFRAGWSGSVGISMAAGIRIQL